VDADDVERIRARVRRHDYQDGLGELAIGIFAGLVAALGLVLPQSVLNSAGLLVLMGAALLGQWVRKRGRERLTYPRTGVAVPRTRWGVVVGGLVLTAVAMTVWKALGRPEWTAGYALAGMISSACFVVLALWRRLPRLALVGLAVAGVTLVLAWLRVPEELGMALVLLGLGLALMGSGGFALIRYLRRTRRFAEDSDAGH